MQEEKRVEQGRERKRSCRRDQQTETDDRRENFEAPREVVVRPDERPDQHAEEGGEKESFQHAPVILKPAQHGEGPAKNRQILRRLRASE